MVLGPNCGILINTLFNRQPNRMTMPPKATQLPQASGGIVAVDFAGAGAAWRSQWPVKRPGAARPVEWCERMRKSTAYSGCSLVHYKPSHLYTHLKTGLTMPQKPIQQNIPQSPSKLVGFHSNIKHYQTSGLNSIQQKPKKTSMKSPNSLFFLPKNTNASKIHILPSPYLLPLSEPPRLGFAVSSAFGRPATLLSPLRGLCCSHQLLVLLSFQLLQGHAERLTRSRGLPIGLDPPTKPYFDFSF